MYIYPRILYIRLYLHIQRKGYSILDYTCIYRELSKKKTGFFKEQNAGFSAQIHRVSLTKTWFSKKGMLSNHKTNSLLVGWDASARCGSRRRRLTSPSCRVANSNFHSFSFIEHSAFSSKKFCFGNLHNVNVLCRYPSFVYTGKR